MYKIAFCEIPTLSPEPFINESKNNCVVNICSGFLSGVY